jgi:hypothetical protein
MVLRRYKRFATHRNRRDQRRRKEQNAKHRSSTHSKLLQNATQP